MNNRPIAAADGPDAVRPRADFRAVVGDGSAVFPLVSAIVGRLPLSMAPLGLVLLVSGETASFALAGATAGVYSAGTAVGAPIWGRLMDRWGQRRIVGPVSALSAVLLAGVVWAVMTHLPSGLVLAAAAASGLTRPALTAALRTAWPHLLADPAARRAGFVLDAVAVESLFVLGPLLLSALLLGPTWLPITVTAGLLLVGSALYGASRAAVVGPAGRAQDGEPRLTWRRVITAPGVPAALLGTATATVATGCLITSLAATAVQVLGGESRIGVLYLAIGGGAMLGGFLVGAAMHHDQARRLPPVLVALGVGLLGCAAVLSAERPPIWLLLAVLAFTGLWIAPVLIAQQYVVEAAVPGGNAVEVQSWLATAIAVGIGVGSTAAGSVVQSAGLPWAFVLAAGAAAAAALIAVGVLVAGRRRAQGRQAAGAEHAV